MFDNNLKFVLEAITKDQQGLYRKVKSFVLSNRKLPTSRSRTAQLVLPNTLPARDRGFVTKLAADLNLLLTWDEYDCEGQNLVVFRLPTAMLEPEGPEAADADDGEWEDEDDEATTEANNAVDRVLKKYSKMKVMADDEGDFDERHEKRMKDKMDSWKRDYYRVSCQCFLVSLVALNRKLSVGEARDELRRSSANWSTCISIRGRTAVGHALLLQRRDLVGMVL